MPPRTDHTLLVHGHSGTFQFYYVRKKAFVIGVGVSCDLLIDTKVLATAFKRTRFCIIERRGNPQETYIKVSDGIPVQVNGKVPVPNQHHTLPNGAYLTLPTTPDDAPVKGSSISLQYWNIAPGSVFEAFRLENCWSELIFRVSIGQGGFGAVYRAVHKSSKSEYAIKIVRKARQLPLHYDQDPVDREIAILKDITHPAVVHLHNVYNERHTYCSLQDLLKDERRIVESDAKLAIIDNILVRSRNPLSVKLADFGIAKMLDQHTYFQTMCGTPDFMAPEITRMEKYDFKVDTWALGVTLFMLLSGHSPFPRDRGTACLDNINAETPAIRWDRLPKDSAQPRQSTWYRDASVHGVV
ncbi:kinase-like domain-containing protein [Ganoderma leucocontextum]|nr:kinase-like domain-containing protein [Ganoderma leucocontextum]